MSLSTRADTPLPGLRFGAAAAYLALHDAATSTWRWREAGCTGAPGLCVTSVVSGWAGASEPLPGFFDRDEMTDLVTYNPALAQFTIRWSTGGYVSQSVRTFDHSFRPLGSYLAPARAGAHVVRGLTSTTGGSGSPVWRQRESLALWDPHTGNWQMDWRPHETVSPEAALCAWGGGGDLPIAGLGGILQSSPSGGLSLPPGQFAVFRSAGQMNTGDGYLHPLVPSSPDCTTGGYYGSANQGATPARFQIGAVADMTGDQIPEMWQISAQRNRIYVYSSESGYTSFIAHEVPYLAEIL